MNTICSSSIEFDANVFLLLLITWYSIVDWLTCCTWKRLCSENLGRFFAAHDMIFDDRSNSHQSCRAIKRPASGLDKSISHSHCCRSFVKHPSIFLSRLPWNLNPLLKSSSNQWKLWEGMQKKEISLGCKKHLPFEVCLTNMMTSYEKFFLAFSAVVSPIIMSKKNTRLPPCITSQY